MSDTSGADPYAAVERRLLARWPETKLDPSLDRIAALCDLLGQPQQAYPVVHLTGTNGKTSTSRMIDTLLLGLGLRTGRFTSPHVESMTERISVDGSPLSHQRFVEVYDEVEPYAQIIDRSGHHPLSFFELVTGMAFAAFADAPVDAAVVEVGMGGSWDATNVADAAVAVVTPVGVDHAGYLGETPGDIALEKSGIIKPGSFVVLAQQQVDAAEILLRRVVEVEATVAREGMEFGVVERAPGIGGQLMTLRGLAGTYSDLFLPLYGAHQAQNAVCALAAVEAFVGGKGLDGGLDVDLVRECFGRVTSPGRLEIVRRSPTVLVDAAHNPHGAAATAAAMQEAFTFSPLVGVLGVMADKDVVGLLEAFEPVMSFVVCTQNSTPRSMSAESLAAVARGIFGTDRVQVAPRLDDAIERAITWAEVDATDAVEFGGAGVLVTGSVITAGEARTLLGRG
ncbi:MAG: dihydrofolate synthase [Propionibacteriales bacterium]|nr:dihydrofolate synthase [Propionibacteriales bacterium]